MKIFLLMMFLISTISCSSYVKKMHQQIDQESGTSSKKRRRRKYDPYAQYRKKDRRPIKNPKTYSSQSTANTAHHLPAVKRQYKPGEKHRYRAEDLVDNDKSGSLWSGQGNNNYLFEGNPSMGVGDIVIVEIKAELKNKITDELKSTFPKRRRRPKKGAKAAAAKPEEKPAEAAPASATAPASPDKVFDKISTTVVEVINKDYLLIKGRKETTFNSAKRYFEFQGLVSRRDIRDNDSIGSENVLEPRIYVLRY